MTSLEPLLILLRESGVSDLQLVPGSPPRLRRAGVSRSLDQAALSGEQIGGLASSVLGELAVPG